MAIFPCDVKSLCFELSSPFQNFSAEAPDREIFVGFSTGYGPLYPPLGETFLAAGCVRFCESDVSQEEANLCADRQVVECLSVKWPVYRPGVDVFGNPVPVPENSQIFFNRAQTATVQCPDGNPFVFTVPAGVYADFSQVRADQAAASRAAELAAISILCISNLDTQTCSNEPYASSVTATGNDLNPALTCWEIFGVLPPGIESDLDTSEDCRTGSNTLNFFGVPTVPGFYPFAIQVQDGHGNFMVKPVTMQIIGITTTALPDGQPFVAYSAFIDAGGVTNPIFALESGTLPAGLAFDTASGEIFGTPIQAEVQPLTFSVTEAGTGITCTADPITLEIVGPTNCANTPTETTTHPDAGTNYSSIAFSGDTLILASEAFSGTLDLFDVDAGAFVFVTTQPSVLILGRVIWSPTAGEWVYVATDAGTNTQVWFTSFHRLTLAQTGISTPGNEPGAITTFQPWALNIRPSTGLCYAVLRGQTLWTYNSNTHAAGASVNFGASTVRGSIGVNDVGNRIYVPLDVSGVLSIRNATTLAAISAPALPATQVNGCIYNPDNGMVYIGGNDAGGDGGDVIWVMDPATGLVTTTIRLLTSIWRLVGTLTFYPATFAYNSSSKQIYIFASRQTGAPVASGGVQVICTETDTKIAFLSTASDPNFGLFVGDSIYADVQNTIGPSTPTNFMAESLNGFIRGYTFP